MIRLRRVARALTLPETRALLRAVARSDGLRALPGRAIHDRPGLLRDLRHPGGPRAMIRSAAAHPVTHELANVGLVLLPVRRTPLGWVAKWAAGKAMRRYLARPIEPQQPDEEPDSPTI